MLSYQQFREGPKGRAVAALAADDTLIAAMELQSRAGEPAVAAIDAAVAETIGQLDDTERQHAGRLVRDALSPRGWYPARRKRIRNGRVFSSGAVYDRHLPPSPASPLSAAVASRPSVTDRIAAARAVIASVRAELGTVDDFLADRHREARSEANTPE